MAWAPDYCEIADLMDHMRIPDYADTAVMLMAISASSRTIDKATNRQFGSTTAQDRFYQPYWDAEYCKWAVETDDIASDTGFTVHWDSAGDETYATEITDYRLTPVNAGPNGRPWEGFRVNESSLSVGFNYGHSEIRVNAQFGWASVPPTIKQATILQASRLVTRRDAPLGILGSSDAGSELRILSKLDADVAVIVRPYYRWWGMV